MDDSVRLSLAVTAFIMLIDVIIIMQRLAGVSLSRDPRLGIIFLCCLPLSRNPADWRTVAPGSFLRSCALS